MLNAMSAYGIQLRMLRHMKHVSIFMAALAPGCNRGDGDLASIPPPDWSLDATPVIDSANIANVPFPVMGMLSAHDGSAVPASGTVAAIWADLDGFQSSYYWWGGGASNAYQFTMVLGEIPPEDATRNWWIPHYPLYQEFGVAALVLLPSTNPIPSGMGAWPREMLGATTRHAIIWRNAEVTDGPSWLDSFSPGYSCGRCIPGDQSNYHDGYEPVDCSNVIIEVTEDPESLAFCEWG